MLIFTLEDIRLSDEFIERDDKKLTAETYYLQLLRRKLCKMLIITRLTQKII